VTGDVPFSSDRQETKGSTPNEHPKLEDQQDQKTSAGSEIEHPADLQSHADSHPSSIPESEEASTTESNPSSDKSPDHKPKKPKRGRGCNDHPKKDAKGGPGNGGGGNGTGPKDSKNDGSRRNGQSGRSLPNNDKGFTKGSERTGHQGGGSGENHSHKSFPLDNSEYQQLDDGALLCVGIGKYPQSYKISHSCSLVRLPDGEFTIDFFGKLQELPDEVLDPTSGKPY
jgi:hypothetical protein